MDYSKHALQSLLLTSCSSPPLDIYRPDQWDALPEAAKIQIVLGIGFLEWWSELRLEPGQAHYMKGGKPGYIPAFDSTPDQLPHWIGLNLWDPFKFTSKLSPAQKEAKLLTEVCIHIATRRPPSPGRTIPHI